MIKRENGRRRNDDVLIRVVVSDDRSILRKRIDHKQSLNKRQFNDIELSACQEETIECALFKNNEKEKSRPKLSLFCLNYCFEYRFHVKWIHDICMAFLKGGQRRGKDVVWPPTTDNMVILLLFLLLCVIASLLFSSRFRVSLFLALFFSWNTQFRSRV